MAYNQKRQTVKSLLGNLVRITYYHRDPITSSNSVFNRKETYDGVFSKYVFKSTDKFHFNGQFSTVGCINGKNGIRFPIIPLSGFLPLEGPLHNISCQKGSNGYWEIELLVKEQK